MKYTFLVLSLLGMALMWSSCTDECEDVTCLNGGVCVEGDCDCPEGFTGLDCGIEISPCILKKCVNADTCLTSAAGNAICLCQPGYQGELCDSAWNVKYIGPFNVTLNCGSVTRFFEVDNTVHNRFNEVVLENFHNEAGNGSTSRVIAQAVTREGLLINEQFMVFGKVKGIGSVNPVSNNSFSLDYTLIKDRDTLVCRALYER